MAFLPGDHIFIGRGGIGGKPLVKHHAIVVATLSADKVEIVEHGVYNKDGTKKWVAGTGIDLLKEIGQVKRRSIDLKEEPAWTEARNMADPYHPTAVVERALFILDHADLLPAYHLTYCNGECVARWCKTGKFESSQAAGLYDKVGGTINDKVAPAMDSSGQAVSRAIAPKSPTTNENVTRSSSNGTTSNNTMAQTQAKVATGMQQATVKVVGAVRAVGAMVGNRQKDVFDKWAETNQVLDGAFATHKRS